MIWRFLLLALSAFSGFSQAGFYLSMGSTYDQLSHQVKFQGDAANAETGVNQALDFYWVQVLNFSLARGSLCR